MRRNSASFAVRSESSQPRAGLKDIRVVMAVLATGYFLRFASFSATAARISAFNALSSIPSPS